MVRRRWMMAVALALVAAGCAGDGGSDTDWFGVDAPDPVRSTMSIENQGGSLEGHTPRGFAGFGTGLFAGDNLNQNFPNDDGVQIWLTFEVPSGTAVPGTAVLRSDVLSLSGSPFADLGTLRAQPVSYEVFEPAVFDTEPTGAEVACMRVGDSSIECDVTTATAAAIADGESRVQFRLRFDTVGDGDGQQDLALFFLTDSNTNEPGIFTLDVS